MSTTAVEVFFRPHYVGEPVVLNMTRTLCLGGEILDELSYKNKWHWTKLKRDQSPRSITASL